MVHKSVPLIFATCLTVPAVGSAQTVSTPVPPDAPLPPLRLFKEAVPESRGGLIESIKSHNWWEHSASGSQVPRWAIGHTVAINTAGRLAFSAGFFGRRGDPLPLYLSEVTRQTPAGNFVTGPGTYKLQWDAKFGVSAPLWKSPRLKVNAFVEVFVPLTGSTDSSAAFLASRALRFGIAMAF